MIARFIARRIVATVVHLSMLQRQRLDWFSCALECEQHGFVPELAIAKQNLRDYQKAIARTERRLAFWTRLASPTPAYETE